MTAMTLQQKRKRNVILMLAVLVLSIAAFVGLTIYNNHKDDLAKGTRITKTSPKKITELTFYRADTDQTVELELDAEGVWHNVKYPEANLIQGYVKYMCNSLTEVRLQKKVQGQPAEYGLDQPSMVIQAKAGSEDIRLTIGDKNAAGVGYYVTYGGSEDIWLMGSEYFEGIDYTGGSLVYPETIQPLTVASIVRLERTQDGQTMVLDYDEDSGSSFLSLVMTEPFHGQVYANKMQMTNFIDVYNMLTFDSCYDYDCQDFSKYGFDDPTMTLKIRFRDQEDHEIDYLLEFGDKNEDGDYYVRTNYFNNVNIINGTNAFTFLSFNVFDYVYRTLFPGVGDDVEKITISRGGKDVVLTPDGSEQYENIGSLVRLLSADAVAKDSQKAGSEVARIAVDWKGRTDVWTFYEYDENSLYLLDLNGKDRSFVVTKSSVDEILTMSGLK
ncbi:MAG: DUF4340 domain-containing protein [Lachnospiraceae bacterium]|nr:DUF4340 domain-containing protein [Lachnospiraceae bacterium]